MKRSKSKLLIVLGVVALLALGLWYINERSTTTFSRSDSAEVKMDSDEQKKKDEIRARADIQKQQELLVQETYLLEQKDAKEKAKQEAIDKYDAELASIETELEAVRGEKISFQ